MRGNECRDNATPDSGSPLGTPGCIAEYRHPDADSLPGSVVSAFWLALGAVEQRDGAAYQWFHLRGIKPNAEHFRIWLLTTDYLPQSLDAARESIARYILQEGDAEPLEFRDKFTGAAVLPSLGAWQYLIPRSAEGMSPGEVFSEELQYLGHSYVRHSLEETDVLPVPAQVKMLELLPDVLIGPAHNTKQKDQTRRFDRSDYELIRLTQQDYCEMIDAGINCLRVDSEQVRWIEYQDVFYWGIGGDDVSYPETLYRSNYLGPTIFMDEPAVCTRDHVLRPRLEEDEAYRDALTPQMALRAFEDYFHKAKHEGAPTRLLKGLAARQDVDLGDMAFLQQNIYSWETMISSAMLQLGEDVTGPPSALVFEPPSRVGTRRTLPEMNMTYGCQIPVDNPQHLTSILYGFLRGAARSTCKNWGMSIYGQFDRADAFWFQTHAYDLGAKYFLYWDTHELACVPYAECLALSRNLRAHAESHPERDLHRLREAAEVAILLPPGYNLGHVHMGRGNLWGLDELNLERTNREGVTYRTVMANVFTEIERCIRLGVAYDLLWDLNDLTVSGYREVIRIREDGKVEVHESGHMTMYEGARLPARPAGTAPKLSVELSSDEEDAPLSMTACAYVVEGSAPIYYTVGINSEGIYPNTTVGWELFGPKPADYRFLNCETIDPCIERVDSTTKVLVRFRIEEPGQYRLRAATADLAGRSAVAWKEITVS